MEETQVFQPLQKHKNMFQKQHKASHFFYRFFLYVQFNPHKGCICNQFSCMEAIESPYDIELFA